LDEITKNKTRQEQIKNQIIKLEMELGSFSKDEKLQFVANWIEVRNRLLAGNVVSGAPALMTE
jgi:hypothetical protein